MHSYNLTAVCIFSFIAELLAKLLLNIGKILKSYLTVISTFFVVAKFFVVIDNSEGSH